MKVGPKLSLRSFLHRAFQLMFDLYAMQLPKTHGTGNVCERRRCELLRGCGGMLPENFPI